MEYKVYWITDIKIIDYFLKGYEFLCIELNVVLHCISWIWHDNGKNDTLSKLERRGTVTKKVEYSITCRLSKVWYKNTIQGV